MSDDDVASGGRLGKGWGVDAKPPDEFAIEPATVEDRLDILRVLDAAMLSVDTDALEERIADGDVLVARFRRTRAVVGAVVLTRPEPERRHVDAVAVRRERRGRGLGSALVAEAIRMVEVEANVKGVTAAFDPSLEGFYTDLGFEIMSAGEREGDRSGGSGVDGDGGDDDRLWRRRDVTGPADRL